MTAIYSHFARDAGINLKLQLLTVPATDMRHCPIDGDEIDPTCPYPSFVTMKGVPWGPMGRLQWFLKYWLGEDPGKMTFCKHDVVSVFSGVEANNACIQKFAGQLQIIGYAHQSSPHRLKILRLPLS